MGKLGKESLVRWSSINEVVNGKRTKIWRSKTFMYMGAIALILGGLFFMSGEKEYMLLNINKTTQLYKIKEGNIVENNFLLLFQNTDNKPHTYKIEIVGEYRDKIEIKRFSHVTLKAGKPAKKGLVYLQKSSWVMIIARIHQLQVL